MNEYQFLQFLRLLMCSDPWPVAGETNEQSLKEWADQEAQNLGYENWGDAYHKLKTE